MKKPSESGKGHSKIGSVRQKKSPLAIPAKRTNPTLGAQPAPVLTESRTQQLLDLSEDFERFMRPKNEPCTALEALDEVVKIQTVQLKMLGFSQRQVDAFRLLAQWEGQSGPEFVIRAMVAVLRASFEELQSLAAFAVGPNHRLNRELVRARKYYNCMLVLLDGKGGAK